MRLLRLLAMTTAAGLATISSAAAPSSPLDVSGLHIRLRSPDALNDELVVGLSFAADSAPAFDAANDDVQIAVGSSDVFRVGPGVHSTVRARGQIIDYRRARGPIVGTRSPFRRLLLDLGRGRIRARVEQAGSFALRYDSNWNVPVSLRIGAATFATAVDFGVARDGRTWSAPPRPDRTVRLVPGSVSWIDSSIWDPRALVVRDASTWSALWAEHVKDVDLPPAQPSVDFSRDMVVAVFRQGTGIGLTIDGFETKMDRIMAHFTVSEAGPHCLVPQNVEHLYAFALLPRSDLPVAFDERRIVVDCLR